ncbi:MAG TPA: serine hydrolase domain-containing protein [Caulobacteraceae bacterium]|jgi:CubicO group peptidase (beta-lactamase class C family)
MNRRAFTLLAASALALPAAPAFALAGLPDLDAVTADALKDSKVPAVGVLVIRDGAVAGKAVRGVRRNDRPDRVTPDDVWHIGSDGKSMTATMIARLIDRGVLSWDAPLEKMLPELAADMQPAYRPATLVTLMAHHAGLPHDYSDEKALVRFFDDPRPTTAQRLDYFKLALAEAPVNTPGTAFSYSNTGFLLAAACAEHATGQSYEALMQREVYDPLGMRTAAIGVTHDPQTRGHVNDHPASEKDAIPRFFGPAGNMYMSLDDWSRFAIDQIDGWHGHGKLLKPATYHKLQTPAFPPDTAGLGWGASPTALGRKGPALTHAGSDGTMYAIICLFPEARTGLLVACNAGEAMGGDKVVKAAMKPLLPCVSDEAPAEAKPAA